ncbi:hypothetical protein [Mesoterricola silvestris]|uniref:Uncharacterized protein n=1 Tax=Mesoterricola silvestris TaxID=2927979 RepID=A0AA48GMP8_9BACT|nr:hypothetical protein [Mesoterricola silvestris]BDU72689.1 hypothetical protein METEAL_18630 [Mesoterricola silvestris]
MNPTQTLEVQRMRGMRNGALAVAVFLFAMVPWRLSTLPGPGPMRLLAWHAGLWGLAVLAYALLLDRPRFRGRNAERHAFALMLLGLAVTGSQLYLYGRLQESASILIVSLASGVVLNRRIALAAFQAILLATWTALALSVAGPAQTGTWVFDIVLAGLFAISVQELRRRSLAALERRLARQRVLIRTNTTLVAELQEALGNVQSLSGLIPICAHCKKIRNDGGYWEQVESYLHAHSEIEFTHGICPDCATAMREELTAAR